VEKAMWKKGPNDGKKEVLQEEFRRERRGPKNKNS